MQQATIEAAATQLLTDGYAKVTMGDELADQVSKIFEAAEGFFSRPTSEKASYAAPNILEGYRQLGIEYSKSKDRPDLNESFSTWLKNVSLPTIQQWGATNNLHRSMTEALQAYSDVTNKLLNQVRLALNPEASPLTVGDISYLQLNYYQPGQHARDYLQDEHEDGHLLTIVKPTAPGLEVKVKGAYHQLEVSPTEFLVMPGSILSLFTGGRIPPLYHRVRKHANVSVRKSLMFFVNPSMDVAHEPWMISEANKNVDIRETVNERSAAFGLNPIQDTVVKTHSHAGY